MRIETDRLILRYLNRDDVEDVLIYQSDPESVAYIPWPSRTRDEVLASLEKAETFLGFETESATLFLAITLKATGQVIGQLNTSIVNAKNSTANIGYVLNRAFTGNGYVNEAVSALIEHIFSEHQIHRITADIDVRNSASVKVVERLGFRLEGTFVDSDFCKGEWCTMHLFALLNSEWQSK
jgi:aminoglycoside 6'-N-acetyltransferase